MASPVSHNQMVLMSIVPVHESSTSRSPAGEFLDSEAKKPQLNPTDSISRCLKPQISWKIRHPHGFWMMKIRVPPWIGNLQNLQMASEQWGMPTID